MSVALYTFAKNTVQTVHYDIMSLFHSHVSKMHSQVESEIFDWFDSLTKKFSASDLFSSSLIRDIPDSTLKPFASIGCWFFFILRKIPLLTLSLMPSYAACSVSYMQLKRNFFFVVSYFDDDQYSVVRLLLMWLDRSQVA